MMGLLGKKLGMTQIFDEQGRCIPVTVVQAGPCYILKVIDKDYSALQLGFDARKTKGLGKARLKFFEKIGIEPQGFMQEIRLSKEEVINYKVGQVLGVDLFNAGDFVDVTGASIGKGFQGGMKRWGWHGGPQTHGSMSHRRPGSISSSTDPSRVFRGHHLPGRMGNRTVTVRNLKVVSLDKENNSLFVLGAVAGHKNSYLLIKKSRKKVKTIKK
jgi:large subunit ribosomal protein L3